MSTNSRSIKGDFIGFTFGGIHSSELGLVRVSDGSRYNEDLLPPLQDKKAQVAGRDGEVYFGSQYGSKPIKVPVAFDNMNEKSFSKLRRLLSNKTPQLLWFDEKPYKQWLVKSANIHSFKWLCFDEFRNGEKERIYKGEGTIEFICFNSYATSRIKYLDETIKEYDDYKNPKEYFDEYKNIVEWKDGSGLKNRKIELEYLQRKINENQEIQEIKTIKEVEFENYEEGFYTNNHLRKGVLLYNAGDVPIKPKIVCKIPEDKDFKQENDIILRLYSFYNGPINANKTEDFIPIGEMIISKELIAKCKEHTKDGKKPYIVVDSKLKMIKGAVQTNSIIELDGCIYNKYHKSGDYLEIPALDDEVYFIEITEVESESTSTQKEKNGEEITESTDFVKIVSVDYTHQYY